MPLAPGRLLCEKYEILRNLGQGGSSDVYAARNRALNKPVAIKTLPIGDTSSQLVRREALAATFRSRNVVEIYDLDTDEETRLFIIVMELLEGASLRSILEDTPRLNEGETVTILRHVLQGLIAVHERGIVHGDLKPSNVFCATSQHEEARCVILDFGIASLTQSGSTELTRTLGGSPLWMNPDSLLGGERRWTADTWALGLLGFHMLTGLSYFDQTNQESLARAIISGPTEPPSKRAKAFGLGIPSWFDGFFDATVSLDHSRLKGARALLDILPDRPLQIPMRRTALAQPESPDPALAATMMTELGSRALSVTDLGSAIPLAFGGAALRGALPEAMLASAHDLDTFLGTLFGRASAAGRVLRLYEPRLDFALAYEFFLIALEPSKTNSIQTLTFVSYTQQLEELLKELQPNRLKVVIVLVDTNQLGAGVRLRIAELFRSYRAALIPAHIDDLRPLRAPRDAKAWLEAKWQANRPAINPFEHRSFDRLLLRGQMSMVNRIVEEIASGARILALYGPPGGGKTRLVQRVQSELATEADVYWISLANLASEAYARDFLKRAAQVFNVPFQIIDGRPADTLTSGVKTALDGARANNRRLVLVIDDAEPLASPGLSLLSTVDDKFIREIRHQFAEILTESAAVCVVLVGMRVFTLDSVEVAGIPNPLRPFVRTLAVSALSRDDCREICEMGQQVDLVFSDKGIARVHWWSSGNALVIHMICGGILGVASQGQRGPVEAATVDAAALELIASRETFEKRLMPWLTAAEKEVLATVPHVRSREPLALASALPTISAEIVGKALDSLVRMGLLARPKGRTRVEGRLFEAWVKKHMRLPASAKLRREGARVRVATIGLAASALLYGFGSWAFQTGEQSVEFDDSGCEIAVSFPSRIIPSAATDAWLRRDCRENSESVDVTIYPVNNTFAAFASGDARVDEFRLAASREKHVQSAFQLVNLHNADSRYSFVVKAGNHEQALEIRRNWLGELPAFGRALVIASGAIPALIGLLFGFYADLRSKVAAMFGGGIYGGPGGPGPAS